MPGQNNPHVRFCSRYRFLVASSFIVVIADAVVKHLGICAACRHVSGVESCQNSRLEREVFDGGCTFMTIFTTALFRNAELDADKTIKVNETKKCVLHTGSSSSSSGSGD